MCPSCTPAALQYTTWSFFNYKDDWKTALNSWHDLCSLENCMRLYIPNVPHLHCYMKAHTASQEALRRSCTAKMHTTTRKTY